MEHIKKYCFLPRNKTMIQSIIKAISVIKSYNTNELELGPAEVASKVGISRSQAYRILKTLSETGLLDQNENSRKYTIGPFIVYSWKFIPSNY